MASVTMPAVISSHSSPLPSMDSPSSAPYASVSPQPSPSSDLTKNFIFPQRTSVEYDRPTSTPAMAIPPSAGFHARRASRQSPTKAALPDFSFNPGALVAENASPQRSPSPKSHPILEEMAAEIAAKDRNLRPARTSQLPPFSFNPGVSGDMQSTPSPTRAAFGDVRQGHRRGGSELGGGEVVATMSTSPATSEDAPARAPPVTSTGARGHRHRRSGALSVAEVDLSSIIKANAIAKHRTGSAPSTPADVSSPSFFDHKQVSTPSSPQSRKSALATPPASPSRRESAPGSLPRPRVAFSDTVAEIPRPLSMISSGTEGSTSTVRPSHSASGSVGSFTSPSRSSSSLSLSGDDSPPRPKTADQLTTPARGSNVSSASSSPKRPLSASGTPSTASSSGSPPTKKKLFWSAAEEEQSVDDQETIEPERAVTESVLTTLKSADSSDNSRPRTSPERKNSVKQRKVKNWTGGIFSISRKGRQRAPRTKGRRTPTPPLLMPSAVDEVFDNDDTVVLEEPVSAPPRLSLLDTQSEAVPLAPSMDDWGMPSNNDIISPVIDLDAALGPFGSEEKFPEAGRAPAAWRRLHSSRGFADPANPYHRRAESAPHLPPVSRNTFGISRMGSNPSMTEEVFDEEEEDDYLAGKDKEPGTTATMRTGSASDTTIDTTEGLCEPVTPDVESTVARSVAADDTVDIVDEEDAMSHVGDRSSNSTILAPILTDDLVSKRPRSAPIDFAFPLPEQPYDPAGENNTRAGHIISCPEADHVSIDSQRRRIHHTTSEPLIDQFLRPSSDDVPSLTDSVSTATGHAPRISSSANTRSSSEQRAASFSGTASWSAARSAKRASLVSLSRLIPGSSHGEKSKLRYGETAVQNEEREKQKRKSNRLSRLVSFLRPKDKA